MTPLVLGALLAMSAPRGAAGAGESGWRQSLSPHFEVFHQANWMPPGFVMSMEKIHSRLRLDLAMFTPWMAKERVKLYLYASRDSYVGGQFEPPAWSDGVALYESKTVAVYEKPSQRELLGTLSHETTHLFFESYWGEVHKRPPTWLNEGLANMEMIESPMHPGLNVWYQVMVDLSKRGTIPMATFVAVDPMSGAVKGQQELQDWYAQAFSVVYFLFHQHTRLQFKSFVAELRDGKTLEEALWLVYRYQNLGRFEAAWRSWLFSPRHSKQVEMDLASAPPEVVKEPIGTIHGFKLR